MSQFIYLEKTKIYATLLKVERFALVEPNYCAILMRQVLEESIIMAFKESYELEFPKYNTSLNDLINNSDFTDLIDSKFGLKADLNSIRLLGNKAAHGIKTTVEIVKSILPKFANYITWFAFNVLEIESNQEPFDVSKLKSNNELIQSHKNEIEQKDKELKALSAQLAIAQAVKVDLIAKKAEQQKNEISWQNVGLTEQMGLIWGKTFVNFQYLDEEFYAVKHFVNEGGAKEKCNIFKGRFENSSLFNMFHKSQSNFNLRGVLDGKSDNMKLVTKFSKERFGTPSILLSKLIDEVTYKMDARLSKIKAIKGQVELDLSYDFTGNYYRYSNNRFRNLLEINKKNTIQNEYNALVVMLNPGASRPIDSYDYPLIENHKDLETNFVPCVPDDTQYQVVRVMEHQKWNRVIVLNLFDLCDTDSKNTYQRYLSNKTNLVESIFHEDRRAELDKIVENLKNDAPIIIGWGMETSIEIIKKTIYQKIIESWKRPILGMKRRDFQFVHPWPRGENNKHVRETWPEHILEQLN